MQVNVKPDLWEGYFLRHPSTNRFRHVLIVLCDFLLFDEHVHAVLKTCGQRKYLMVTTRSVTSF